MPELNVGFMASLAGAILNEPVKVIVAPALQEVRALGTAEWHDGPVIKLSPALATDYVKEQALDTLLHEVAHHKLGHVARENIPNAYHFGPDCRESMGDIYEGVKAALAEHERQANEWTERKQRELQAKYPDLLQLLIR